MKFLHLSGIIVLLSLATSISAATLVPRMERGAEPYDSLYPEIIAGINKIQRDRTPLVSPDDYTKKTCSKISTPIPNSCSS
ncbi:BgTH12-06806 [Blumeria graminis f. sp. triticale]|uniref:Bgt-50876 n=2 Tax=Blumeria graminis TaxID=34373 RepID=A0A9X9QG25_BLUGR|nr:BgTH12-06806 [Blumeria graminis f. sp. triticale]VDB94463.1 Bgt-50876 [Blumeria graminis f. sp. tritici]